MSLYGMDIVGAHWPMDGPHTTESTESAAVAVSELVRYLTRATKPNIGALSEAPHGAGVIGVLATTAHREVQLCRQLAAWARLVATDPTVRHDLCRDDAERSRQMAARSAMVAAAALDDAAAAVGQLGARLDVAHTGIDLLSHHGEAGVGGGLA